MRHRIPVVGIVGGIGSGKSAIANWVGDRSNVAVLNADQLGHDILKSPTVRDALCQRFGSVIVDANGNIDRSAIARLVFGADHEHQSARRDLEIIVHPEIRRRIIEGIELAEREQRDAVLLDAAILLETGWRNECDLVVFVETSEPIRLARVQKGRGWSEEDLRKREANQWPLTDKRRESDVIVQNDTDVETAGTQLLNALIENGLVRRTDF